MLLEDQLSREVAEVGEVLHTLVGFGFSDQYQRNSIKFKLC